MKPDLPVFDQLLGSWTFVRAVSQHATMTGRATIDLVEDGLAAYQETARVILAGGPALNGKQSYLYRRSAPPVNGFDVLFYDTRQLFNRLLFSPGDNGRSFAKASHGCKADDYLSEYALDADGIFHVQHIVSGPGKQYVVKTIYTREEVREEFRDELRDELRNKLPASIKS